LSTALYSKRDALDSSRPELKMGYAPYLSVIIPENTFPNVLDKEYIPTTKPATAALAPSEPA